MEIKYIKKNILMLDIKIYCLHPPDMASKNNHRITDV